MADARLTQASVRTLSQQAAPGAVSRVVVRTLSPFESDPGQIAQAVVRTLSAVSPPAALSRLVVRTLSAYREVTFANAQLTTGLTWLELTRPSEMS